MKRSIWRAAAGVVLTAALTTTAIPSASAATRAVPDRATAPDRATVADFGRLTQAVLAQRTAALVDPTASNASHVSNPSKSRATPAAPTRYATSEAAVSGDARVGLTGAVARAQGTVIASLQARRARLRAAGEAYSAGNTTVSVDRVRVTGERADVLLTETTTLTYEKLRGDEPPTTGFQAEHEATFVATPQGRWELTGITDADAAHAFPQVNEVVPESSQTASVSPLVTGLTPLTATDPPEATPASTHWPAAPNPKPTTRGGNNYSAMAAYAVKYWSRYNTAYRQFNGAGGDCTNFVSQSLKAGGWKFASGWASDYDHTWWYSASNPATQSWSWNGVNEWSWFALSSKRVTNLADVYQLGVGDILQMDFNADGSKDHSMIVTYRSASGMPYVTYHSTNTLNRSVASLVAAYPNARYYAYRT